MPLSYWLITVFSTGFLLLSFKGARLPSLKLLITTSLIVALCAYWIMVAQTHTIESKGAELNDWKMVGLLYSAMALGMAAQYFFYKSARARFRWGQFFRPFLASPIVFIPLLGSLEEARLNFDEFSLARLMLLLVAFQNGFLWKFFFDNLKPLQHEAKA